MFLIISMYNQLRETKSTWDWCERKNCLQCKTLLLLFSWLSGKGIDFDQGYVMATAEVWWSALFTTLPLCVFCSNTTYLILSGSKHRKVCTRVFTASIALYKPINSWYYDEPAYKMQPSPIVWLSHQRFQLQSPPTHVTLYWVAFCFIIVKRRIHIYISISLDWVVKCSDQGSFVSTDNSVCNLHGLCLVLNLHLICQRFKKTSNNSRNCHYLTHDHCLVFFFLHPGIVILMGEWSYVTIVHNWTLEVVYFPHAICMLQSGLGSWRLEIWK